jgi:dihydrofolate synthase/folylpolyglutamate synthase
LKYREALAYIHGLEKFGILPGLERVAALCGALGNPQAQLRCVHVAGTNGKGSTCAMLAGIFRRAGYKTGLYTSPYVTNFCERMQIDGEMIAPEDLAALTERCKLLTEALSVPITEFEFVTALAFAWFAAQKCDVVVLETGLGGRWDATNVITAPMCSVITKIALDHTHILGGTMEKIAAEKAGIFKNNCPAVIACGQDAQALAVFAARAAETNSPCVMARAEECEILSSSLAGSWALLAGLRVFVPFAGRHMCHNALTAVRAARALGLTDACIAAGIADARMPARLEVCAREPLVLLDGGHNPDGARALAAALAEYLPGQRLSAVCGMMADKDAGEYLRILAPHLFCLVACAPPNPRAIPPKELAALARAAGIVNAEAADTPEEALQRAAGDFPLLVCGSFYLAGHLRCSLIKL